MKRTERIIKLLGIPGTHFEYAAIMKDSPRLVYATLCNLKKQGRAKRLAHKREGRRGPPSAIWGVPECEFIGWMK